MPFAEPVIGDVAPGRPRLARAARAGHARARGQRQPRCSGSAYIANEVALGSPDETVLELRRARRERRRATCASTPRVRRRARLLHDRRRVPPSTAEGASGRARLGRRARPGCATATACVGVAAHCRGWPLERAARAWPCERRRAAARSSVAARRPTVDRDGRAAPAVRRDQRAVVLGVVPLFDRVVGLRDRTPLVASSACATATASMRVNGRRSARRATSCAALAAATEPCAARRRARATALELSAPGARARATRWRSRDDIALELPTARRREIVVLARLGRREPPGCATATASCASTARRSRPGTTSRGDPRRGARRGASAALSIERAARRRRARAFRRGRARPAPHSRRTAWACASAIYVYQATSARRRGARRRRALVEVPATTPGSTLKRILLGQVSEREHRRDHHDRRRLATAGPRTASRSCSSSCAC